MLAKWTKHRRASAGLVVLTAICVSVLFAVSPPGVDAQESCDSHPDACAFLADAEALLAELHNASDLSEPFEAFVYARALASFGIAQARLGLPDDATGTLRSSVEILDALPDGDEHGLFNDWLRAEVALWHARLGNLSVTRDLIDLIEVPAVQIILLSNLATDDAVAMPRSEKATLLEIAKNTYLEQTTTTIGIIATYGLRDLLAALIDSNDRDGIVAIFANLSEADYPVSSLTGMQLSSASAPMLALGVRSMTERMIAQGMLEEAERFADLPLAPEERALELAGIAFGLREAGQDQYEPYLARAKETVESSYSDHNTRGLVLVGYMLHRMGRLDQAADYLSLAGEAALAAYPNSYLDGHWFRELMLVLIETGRSDLASQILDHVVDQVLELEAEHIRDKSLSLLVAYQAHAGQFEAARATIFEMEIGSARSGAFAMVAVAQVLAGDVQSARRSFQEAANNARLEPGNYGSEFASMSFQSVIYGLATAAIVIGDGASVDVPR